jgi:TRAP-type uncharacterized transport system substrate-binding protein
MLPARDTAFVGEKLANPHIVTNIVLMTINFYTLAHGIKSKFVVGLIITLALFLILTGLQVGCDFVRPQKSFRLAVPKSEYFYNYMAGHLKPFLNSKGYNISIVPAENIIEAVHMVAVGKAELALVNNHSVTVALRLGDQADKLRTVMPITSRVLFAFSKDHLVDSATAKVFFENKRVGIESLGGETHLTFVRLLKEAKIKGVTFVTFNDNPDVVVFWDRFYGERAEGWVEKGWHPYAFRKNFVEFVVLHDHALRPFKLPALPGDPNSIIARTLATDVILVANRDFGENACYLLAQTIFQNKVDLIHRDIMYNSINEVFNKETLLFPLHQGTFSYLLRDQPTFLQQYADSLALGLSVIAVLYSLVLAIQSRLRRNQKERIDKYFIEFLAIRSSKTTTLDERVKKLDELFSRAVVQMTNERLDKGDFHILSRLIQQDLTMLRFN